MKVFCKGGEVVATHTDDQKVPPMAYGDDVDVMTVSDDFRLQRLGPEPEDGADDFRPFARPVLSLEAAKVAAQRDIIEFADNITDKIMSKYPKAEQKSWDEQAVQARVVDAGGSLDPDDLLSKLAAGAEVDIGDYAAAVLAKAAYFENVTVAVKTMRDRAEAALDQVDKAEDIKPALAAVHADALLAAEVLGLG